MATDREILNKAVASLVGGSAETAADMLVGGEPANTSTGAGRQMQRRQFMFTHLIADPAAGDATTNGVCNTVGFWTQVYIPHRSKLVDAKLDPKVALTSSNTTYATINITKDNGAGGAQTAVLSATTKNTGGGGTGGWTVGQMVNLTPYIVTTSDAHIIAAGSYLQIQVAKASTGVVLNPCVLEIVVEEI